MSNLNESKEVYKNHNIFLNFSGHILYNSRRSAQLFKNYLLFLNGHALTIYIKLCKRKVKTILKSIKEFIEKDNFFRV